MIVREYLNCATCDHPHIARIQVGHGGRQEHSFLCFNCNEPIQIAMDVDNKNLDLQFHLISNCKSSTLQEGTPVYLSSDFVANKKMINEEFYFGSFDFFKSIISSENASQYIKPLGSTGGKSIPEAWVKIKKIWRLEDSKKYLISGPLNYSFAEEFNVEEPSLRNNIYNFISSIFKSDDGIIKESSKALAKNESEFLRFLHFYQSNLKVSHRRSSFDILSDYFDNYSAYSQIFPYVRSDMPLPISAKVTSLNFNDVRSFYAKAYEFYSSQICIFTCLNNIIEGREFDKLNSMDLRPYMRTDKAKRRDSFTANRVFTENSREFDSKVRNASYHNWFFLLADNDTIELRSGGTGAVETMTYTQYLYQCVSMVAQICKLLEFELFLDQVACDVALVTRFPVSKNRVG